MLLSLLGLILGHPNLVMAALAAACGLGFVIFKGAFLDFLLHPRTMLMIAAVVGVLSFASLKNDNAKLHAENQALAAQIVATHDAQTAVTTKVVKVEANHTRTQSVRQAIQGAPTGEKVDAALDKIADTNGTGDDARGAKPQPDGLRNNADATRP